jgi:hypothetical protein
MNHPYAAAVLLAACATAADLVPPVELPTSVGWGFVKHGGFPANPWASYQMNLSTTAYFVGNASGMDDPSELHKETQLGYVGIGWQLNNKPSNFTHLESFELLEAQRLKALRPDIKIGVLRNTEVVTVFWDSARKVMFDPATQDYWTQCDGKPCAGTWRSPAGNTVKYFLNYSNPKMVDWWIYTYIGQALNESDVDGIYFDCSCGKVPGVPDPDVPKFSADAQAAFDRALAFIKSKNKWASAWNSDGAISQRNCASTMNHWMQKGANDNLTLQILGQAFRKHSTEIPSPDAASASTLSDSMGPACGTCEVTAGMDAISAGIIADPIPNASTTSCCAACKANPRCEAFITGPCSSSDPVCKHWPDPTVSTCFLVHGYKGLKPNKDRATGCVRKPPSPAPSPTADAERNVTVAAFLIARGRSVRLLL